MPSLCLSLLYHTKTHKGTNTHVHDGSRNEALLALAKRECKEVVDTISLYSVVGRDAHDVPACQDMTKETHNGESTLVWGAGTQRGVAQKG